MWVCTRLRYHSGQVQSLCPSNPYFFLVQGWWWRFWGKHVSSKMLKMFGKIRKSWSAQCLRLDGETRYSPAALQGFFKQLITFRGSSEFISVPEHIFQLVTPVLHKERGSKAQTLFASGTAKLLVFQSKPVIYQWSLVGSSCRSKRKTRNLKYSSSRSKKLDFIKRSRTTTSSKSWRELGGCCIQMSGGSCSSLSSDRTAPLTTPSPLLLTWA